MAKTRVHDLAKEFGISSKEMLEHLNEMKIPAKSASSSLEDAYVSIIRKKLKPIIEAHAAEVEAQKRAEAEAKAEEEKAAAEEAEKQRIAVEKRRQKEREEEEKRLAAEKARKEAEERRRAEEKRRREEEEEKKRVRDTAPKMAPSFNSLLDQIAQQEEVLKKQEQEKAEKKKEEREARNNRRRREPSVNRGESRDSRPSFSNAPMPVEDSEGGHGRKGRKGRKGEDRYSRMAREAEEFTRSGKSSKVYEEAREAIEEAHQSTGRRKKRKERRKKQQAEAEQEQRIEEAIKNDQDLSQLDTVKVPQGTTVADLAKLLGVEANDIIKRLFLLGSPLTLTESMSDDLIELVADDLGVDVKVMTKEEENSFTFYDDPKDLKLRPPVVTVMGHVDHGKTSLLDAIRHTGVAEGEAGGITQAIGASKVTINDRTITFIDTPGHETFTAMRARGAKVTDIVILIVAADDGVMPQTIEAINHAKAADVPIVVAINKMDKPAANADRIMQDLTKFELIPEAWGGDTIMVPVSAVTGDGVDDLLEMILLQADTMELKANPNRMAKGVIIEAKLDKARGPLATVLLQNGTLKVGDNIVAGMASGRVRAMVNDRGERVQKAGPSTPVEISGFNEVPLAGDEMIAVADDHLSRQVAQERRDKVKAARANTTKVSLDNLFAGIAEGKVQNLNIIIKADVQGSVEAVKQALEKLSNDEVKVRVLHSAVGAITQDDVNLASAFNAIIIGFNIRPDSTARDAAEREGVDIRLYRIIYQAIEDVEKAMKGLLAPEFKENLLGHAQVRSTFKITGAGTIAGSYVTDGKVQRNASVRLLRDNVIIFEGKLSSLRRFKDDVKEVASGYECGIGLENYNDIKEGDVIECFVMEEIER